jgi:broad specificity phosphatase PhoE
MTIYLLRHGETRGNAERIVQLPDIPLSDRGREQARKLGARLATLPGTGIAQLLASDLARARETAELVRDATGAPLELDPLLHERNLGDVRGTPYAELDVDLFGPDYAPPGGETWEIFHARVDLAWQRILEVAAVTRGHLAVVSHGLVCLSLARRHLSLPSDATLEAGVGNTSVTEIQIEPPYVVTLFNCTAHLEDDDRGDGNPGATGGEAGATGGPV